jgi:2-keto-3-deoxy-L-rhamnonate aldolase RhmA
VKQNPVKDKLARGELVAGLFRRFTTVGMPRMLASAGDEFVLFDQEHTAWVDRDQA